jgi:hypothetical protein
MKKFNKLWMVSLFGVLALAQESLAARSLVLGTARGEDFKYADARSLDPNTGIARVEFEKLEFDQGQFLLHGSWQNKPFISLTEADHPGGILKFEIGLIDQNFPCGELRIEKATLLVGPRSDGELEFLEGRLSVERSADTCHLSVQTFDLKLEERQSSR